MKENKRRNSIEYKFIIRHTHPLLFSKLFSTVHSGLKKFLLSYSCIHFNCDHEFPACTKFFLMQKRERMPFYVKI